MGGKVGRPTKYSPALSAEICRRLAEGQSLREICRDAGMPDRLTVLRWLTDGQHVAFRNQYAQAREDQADHFFDEMFEIADDGTNDWVERTRRDGTTETVLDREHVERSKLRIDTRKWALARMSPKKYGERVLVEGDRLKERPRLVFIVNVNGKSSTVAPERFLGSLNGHDA